MQNLSSDIQFSGEITVPSKIIDDLSSKLYTSPAACLKELINNSYDADAARVNVFVKPDADRIIIEDDGIGMNRKEFEKHFKRVSESHKRDEGDITQSGRPKIGKIGIGFIAANELCDVMEIYSTKTGSTDLLHVFINFQEMRKPAENRRREGDDIAKADYIGEVLKTDRASHYTQLFLTSLTYVATSGILAGASSQKPKPNSLYGLKPDSVAKLLKSPTLNTWKDLDFYSETMLEVALNIPVKYHAEWVPQRHQAKVKDFEESVEKLKFNVFYDGSELRKPIVFSPPDKATLIDRFEFNGEHVAAKGYFYAQHGTVKPREIQGLLVRIRNAAVGEYDHSLWGFSQSDSGLIQRWISAEIWADDKLEDAMNIDRRSFRVAHPAYVELRNAIHKHLRKVLNQATNEIYKAGRDERVSERNVEIANAVQKLAQEVVAPISPAAAQKLRQSLKRSANHKDVQKALQRKFSVVEFYETIIEAAEDVLTPKQLAALLERLAERVGQ